LASGQCPPAVSGRRALARQDVSGLKGIQDPATAATTLPVGTFRLREALNSPQKNAPREDQWLPGCRGGESEYSERITSGRFSSARPPAAAKAAQSESRSAIDPRSGLHLWPIILVFRVRSRLIVPVRLPPLGVGYTCSPCMPGWSGLKKGGCGALPTINVWANGTWRCGTGLA
jgi:hypothetical protein